MKYSALFAGIIWTCVAHMQAPIALALSLVIESAPETLEENAEGTVNLHFDCGSCQSDSYIRAVFYPSGTSYFGYTQTNDGSWVNAPGSSCTSYFSIPSSSIKSGTWSGELKIKPDVKSSYYQGPGEYLFKIGRYTGSCSSPTWSLEKTIAILGPTHTPTPTPTLVPTPSPSYTPTNSPTQVATLTPTPSLKTLNTSTSITPIIDSTLDVLGASDEGIRIKERTDSNNRILGGKALQRNDTPQRLKDRQKTIRIIITCALIGAGFALLAAVYAWRAYQSEHVT